jgi:hypothetical protein
MPDFIARYGHTEVSPATDERLGGEPFAVTPIVG